MEVSSMTNLKKNISGKLESVQYCKFALVITGAIQGTCRDKIYQELEDDINI